MKGRNMLLRIVCRAHQKNLNEDRPMLSVAECMWMILVSRSIRFAHTFAGFPREGVPNNSGVLKNRDAQAFPSKFPTLKPT